MSSTSNKPTGANKSTNANKQQSNQNTTQANRLANTAGKGKQVPFPNTGNTPSLQLHKLPSDWCSNIINAPTSLTNLAQLSGISFLPISNIKPTSRQVPTNSAHQSNLPKQSNTNIISVTNSLEALQYVDRLSNSPQITSSSRLPNTQQGNNSHANIPSAVQLLNPISTSKVSQWVTNPIGGQARPQASSKPTTKVHNRAKKTKPQSNSNTNQTSQLNDIQVISVPDSMQIFPDLPSFQPTQSGSAYDDLSSQPSLESTIEDKCIDINGDMNNISLVKLMAILNNPALTITAVNTKDIQKSSHRHSTTGNQSSNKSTNYIDGQQVASASQQACVGTSQLKLGHGFGETTHHVNQKISSSKARIPQSATNLQIIHGSSTDCILPSQLNDSTSLNADSQTINNDESDQNQSDFQLNWLSNYNPNATMSISKNRTKSWVNQSINPSSMINEHSSFHLDKTDDPLLSTSVRNLLMQQQPSNSKKPTVSVQLLKHIADQAQDNNDWSMEPKQKSILEPECILSLPPVQQIQQGVKRTEITATVTSSPCLSKATKVPLRTTKQRLYIPKTSYNNPKRKKCSTEAKFNLNKIDINMSKREVHLSDRHFMLESMMPDDDRRQARNVMSEPDEIFINRSKRVMSKIDTMVERKKRRRFERISGRAAPKTNSLEEQCAESEGEWSSDENMDINSSTFITSHLPLEEPETSAKKTHLMAVGLVSRDARNRILVEQCEERMKIFCPLKFEQPHAVSSDVRRFVDTMIQTGGTDIQLRIESNIKRNDLPLLEGLNRNTSRHKMTYMSVLGLEKRSKRTTLYKMKPNESQSVSPSKMNDLNKVKSIDIERKKVVDDTPQQAVTPVIPTGNTIGKSIPMSSKLTLISCRDAIRPPNKDEYMKSLGLMAS